jgi:hypothetical protein
VTTGPVPGRDTDAGARVLHREERPDPTKSGLEMQGVTTIGAYVCETAWSLGAGDLDLTCARSEYAEVGWVTLGLCAILVWVIARRLWGATRQDSYYL